MHQPVQDSPLASPGPGLQGCADDGEDQVNPFTILIFGGGGDLSRKKLLPNLYHLHIHSYLPRDYAIVCAGSPKDTDTPAFRELVRQSVKENAPKEYDEAKYNEFAAHIHFKFLRFENDEAFGELKALVDSTAPDADKLCRVPDGTSTGGFAGTAAQGLSPAYTQWGLKTGPGAHVLLHFLAVPPLAFETVISQIGKFGLNGGAYDARLIIEKPFGTDLESARILNAQLSRIFREDQIYRIDHYLGKETVQNIMFFRFANSMFEPLWNNKHIDNVQITVAEDIGIESRGKFYETSGVIRDIIQNHGLQLLSMVAMEPPASIEADNVRDEKAKVFKSIKALSTQDILRDTVIGQYDGGPMAKPDGTVTQTIPYREESFVSPESITPTFFAGKFQIDNWRWAGVPFYIRAGKRLGKRMTDIVIQFKSAPAQLFGQCQNQEPGTLTLSIQPRESITMRYEVKYPNTVKRVWPVNMTFSYDNEFQVTSLPAYARLILDALKGDLSLFVRQDAIDAMWKFADPIIQAWQKAPPSLPNYLPGSSGPQAAADLLARDGRRWLSSLDPA